MAEKLTPQQKLAVETRGGNLLVSAAAGSGKTKVLVDRLLSYILDPKEPANVDDFLIITYTKAAAAELRGKISDKLSQLISQQPENRHLQKQMQRLYLAKISTVHSFCGEILREFAYRLDIPADFRVAEESECNEIKIQVIQQILDDAYANASNDPDFLAFVNSQGLGRNDRLVPEIILQIHSSAMCHLDPVKWLTWCGSDLLCEDVKDVINTPWGMYLTDNLKKFLQQQIKALSSCIAAADGITGMEKPVGIFRNTVSQLQDLAQCESWDSVVNFPKINYGTLTLKKEHKDSELAEQMKAVREYCKKELSKRLKPFSDSSKDVLLQMSAAKSASRGIICLVLRFMEQFASAKISRRILDFSDIEQKMLELLLGKHRTAITAVADEIGRRFREIMVDEYQDSNAVQDAIFGALTNRRKNCFMVGDVKQSIYQFRLADPGIFLEKYHSYLPVEEGFDADSRKVLLSSNFRSSAGVISAVNDVFTACMSPEVGGLMYDEKEQLREGISHIALGEPEVELYGIQVEKDTYQEEAEFVAQRITELLSGEHYVRKGDTLRRIEPNDIVILLRSPNSVGGEFQYALERRGFLVSLGSGRDLLRESEIETLRAFLKVIHNPIQDIPLIAVLASPLFGFTADELAKIRSGHRHISFYEAIMADNSQKSVNFISVLTQLRQDARFYPISQLLERVYLLTGMRGIYGAMADGTIRCENINAFAQIASSFEFMGRRELSYFLEYLEVLEEKGIDIGASASDNSIRIMSIHKSKGLEFPVVFLCGLSREFNTADVKKQVLSHKDLGLGLSAVNEKQRVRFPTIVKRAISAKILEEAVSEELRVLYVAMTRARDRLIMTYADASLENTLHDLTMRMCHSEGLTITSGADCPGIWVLYAALQRTEAGEFFRLGGYPDNHEVSEIPWKIRVIQGSATSSEIITDEDSCVGSDPVAIQKICDAMQFEYPHKRVTNIPSKLTATQFKGRIKDAELSEGAGSPISINRTFRIARAGNKSSATEKGTAVHTLLQHIHLDSANNEDSVREELARIVSNGLISSEQAQIVDCRKIAEFFCSPLGIKIRDSKNLLREFKFSIFEDAANYYPEGNGERVLLQGVVDCAIIEDDGITVIDFKTDVINESTINSRTELYRTQVSVYCRALSRIFEVPVKEAYLYYLYNGTSVLL